MVRSSARHGHIAQLPAKEQPYRPATRTSGQRFLPMPSCLPVWRRVQIITIVAACLVLVWAGWFAWTSNTGVAVRFHVALAVTGYEGCMCSDCTRAHLGVIRWPYRQFQLPLLGVGDPDLAALLLAGYALFLFIVATQIPRIGRHLVARRRMIARRRKIACESCGYPRSGLPPHVPCPECGRRFSNESA